MRFDFSSTVALLIGTALAASVPKPSLEVTYMEVENIQELITNYSKILSTEEGLDLFYSRHEKVFVARKEKSNNLDDIVRKRGFWNKKKTIDWLILNVTNPEVVTYPGYIPVTECQSQKFGQQGAIGFEYQISNSISHGYRFGIKTSISPVLMANIALRLAVDLNTKLRLGSGNSIGGTSTCFLKPNQTGQLLIKPKYLKVAPDSRRARWSEPLKQWLVDEDYVRYDPFYALIEKNHYRTDCITDDVAPLFCDVKLGEPDWDEPLGVEYDKLQLQI